MNMIKSFIWLQIILCVFYIHPKRNIITVKEYKQSSRFALLEPTYDRKKIKVNKIVDGPSRIISFIADGENNQYVIKQKKKGTVRKQFQVILEKLSAHMAEALEIPAHHVQLLPAGMAFPGKKITDKAASLLTLVPGIPVKNISSGPYAGIDIRQSNRPDWSSEKIGFHSGVRKSIGLHPDLAKLAGFDMCIGNKGRHEANYFYHKETDRFYAIDMDKIYNSNDEKDLISKIACDQVRALLQGKKALKLNQLEGLKLYRDTLQQFVTLFPPERIYELMDEFSVAGGFKKGYLPEIESRVNRIKATIKKSHQHIVELINLLSQLISSGKKNADSDHNE
jgi:hypothetical protein